MKAIVLHEYGSPKNLKYEDFADPQPAAGEVLVRVQAIGVNPIDWKLRSGAMQQFMPLTFPAILGYDIAGVVREVGEGVKDFVAGDLVFARTAASYAELAIVKATELAKIPEGVEITTAAALPVVCTTADQLIKEGTQAQKDQTILLTGTLGAVGRIALFCAQELGIKVIAGVRKKQLDEALALGATAAVAIDDEAELAKLGTVDAVADTIGGPLAEKLIAKVKPGGNFATVIAPPSNAALHPTVNVVAIGSHADPAACIHYAEAIRDNKLKLPIDRMIPLANAAEAHTASEKGGIHGKIILLA